ncbi:MAG: DNA-protecting protein DprA [Armatimonadetes bacterium]|nr:DNA-protecting protein DprA [Armatimonadota bacterium]
MRHEGWRSPTRHHYAEVEAVLREYEHPAKWGAPLRRKGFWEEAAILEDADRYWLASLLVAAGLVLTVGDRAYPEPWRRRLQLGAPPAIWICSTNTDPEVALAWHGSPIVGFVGSRELKPASEQFGFEAARAIAHSGHWLVSGGARGADALGARAVAAVHKLRRSCGAPVTGANSEPRLITILASGFETGKMLKGRVAPHRAFAEKYLELGLYEALLQSGNHCQSAESHEPWLQFIDRLARVRSSSTAEGDCRLRAPLLEIGSDVTFQEWLTRSLFAVDAIQALLRSFQALGGEWARASLPYGGVGLSMSPPGTRFSVGLAMERNALIYGMSLTTFVLASNYNAGGTWAGATNALRRRLCPVLVADLGGKPDPAVTALAALGAERVRDIPALLGRLNELCSPELAGTKRYGGDGLQRCGHQVSEQLALFS